MFLIETAGDQTLVTETIQGVKIRCTFNNQALAEAFMKSRREILEHGLDGALRKWHDEEAKSRRKLNLPIQASYNVTHYGDSTKALCGVEKGVQGNIRQEVVDYTTDREQVTCPECLERM